MISCFSDLRYKEIIDVHTGLRFGFLCDAEFDDREGQITALITPGKARFFGLFGREDDYVIPWKCIIKIGSDIILIEVNGELTRRKRRLRWI